MKYQNILNNKIQCTLCPRNCKLSYNQRGFCFVRRNAGNEIVLDTFGYNTGLAIDPVEKKPLYHFYPSSKVLSFGTLGCNMGCLFCQNSHITKVQYDIKENCDKISPEQIIEIAKKYNCKCVAFTYNDPVIFFEYALSTAQLCKEEGIKTIAVTAGYINEKPRKEFFNLMDSANIDLKGFSEEFYAKNCLAHLAPVLDTIKYAANETNCFIELTTMIIEGENDKYIEAECEWILENLGDSIPLHFSAFSPRYKFLNRPGTKIEALLKAYNMAKNMGIKHVYLGNLATLETSTTYCKDCSKPLIVRNGYNILENNLEGNKCKFCGNELEGLF